MGEEEGDVDMGEGDGDDEKTTDEVPQLSLELRAGRRKGFMGGTRKVMRIATWSRLLWPVSLCRRSGIPNVKLLSLRTWYKRRRQRSSIREPLTEVIPTSLLHTVDTSPLLYGTDM